MKRILVCWWVVLMAAGCAWADGGRERHLTVVEKEFYEKTYQEAMTKMPAAPQGWDVRKEELSIPRMVGEGAENRPFFFDVVCQYQKPMTIDLANAETDMKSVADMGDKMSALSERMNEAIAKGDQKALAAIQKEMQDVVSGNAGIQKMKAKGEDHKRNSALVRIRINVHGVDYWPYKEITPKAPAVFALRSIKPPNNQNSTDLGRTLLFFGPYTKKQSGDTIQIYQSTDTGIGTKVHRLVLEIEAEEQVADELLAKMDLNNLAGLIR